MKENLCCALLDKYGMGIGQLSYIECGWAPSSQFSSASIFLTRENFSFMLGQIAQDYIHFLGYLNQAGTDLTQHAIPTTTSAEFD